MEIEIQGLSKFGKGISIKPSEKTLEKQTEEIFYSIVGRMTDCFERTQKVSDLGIDLTDYDNEYFGLIEDLVFLYYGPIKAEIIFWWVYDLPQLEKSTPIFLVDIQGNKTQIKNIKQLYKYLQKIKD